MKDKKEISIPGLGGSSLLVTFGVLCLVVLALLSLNTVLAEQRISETYEQATIDWYAADLCAQEIFAKLRAGEDLPGVVRQGDRYEYGVAVSEHQVLEVTLEQHDRWEIISWLTVAYPENVESRLPVWTGME